MSHALRGKRPPPLKTQHNELRQIKDQMRGSDKEKCGGEAAQFGNVTFRRISMINDWSPHAKDGERPENRYT